MKKKSKPTIEERHHDEIAEFYTNRRQSDYIWEVPELHFLLTKRYISDGDTVVDMGCGPAVSVHRAFVQLGLLKTVRYLGIDISNNMLVKAKELFPDSKFLHADIAKTGLKKDTADVILSLGALHHSLDKKKTLRHWFDILKIGGFLLMREPAIEYLEKGKGESPLEEGIDIREVIEFAATNGMKVLLKENFYTLLYHYLNRMFIFLGFPSWAKHRVLSIPIIICEAYITRWFSSNRKLGDTYVLVLQK